MNANGLGLRREFSRTDSFATGGVASTLESPVANRFRPRAPPMSTTVTDQPTSSASSGDWEPARRDKLRRIAELGHDPWGSRFDDHSPIAAIRARAGEIAVSLAGWPRGCAAGFGDGRRRLRLPQVARRARRRRNGRPARCGRPAASCCTATRASCSSSTSAT